MLLLGAVLALLIGIALGALGGGGSILMLPTLVYALHVDPKSAIPISLVVVGSSSALAAIPCARRSLVDWRKAAVFGPAAMAGAFGGGHLAHWVPSSILLLSFGLMMLVTSVSMIRGRPATTALPRKVRVGTLIALGIGVGIVSGLVGAGGGFLIVPALTLFAGLPMPRAVGTSLAIIAMQSFAGSAGHLAHTPIHAPLTVTLVAAAGLGSVLGTMIGAKIEPAALRKLFGGLVLATALFVIGKTVTAIVPRAVLTSGPSLALAGGILIGLSASLLLLTHGRIAGISGIYGGLLRYQGTERLFRLAFLGGLLFTGGVLAVVAPYMFPAATSSSTPLAIVAVAGALVGYGTRLGGGCTSGHGVCGMSRLSARSLVATLTFIATGALTVFSMRHLFGSAQ